MKATKLAWDALEERACGENVPPGWLRQ